VLSLKELLNVSSDWKEINNLKGGGGDNASNQNDALSQDFQAKQIERVIDAIALTLPSGSIGNSIVGLGLGGGGNTLSTANLESQNTNTTN